MGLMLLPEMLVLWEWVTVKSGLCVRGVHLPVLQPQGFPLNTSAVFSLASFHWGDASISFPGLSLKIKL